MNNLIAINVTFNETRAAVCENGAVSEIYIERVSHPRTVGNIYKGRVGKVVPGMQAAFIDIGLDKSGFISVEDVSEESLWDIPGEEEVERQALRTRQSLIQDMLREGQDMMVQVIKEPTGGKGAKLSSNVALPGKYLVLLCTSGTVGISRKISDEKERERLSKIIKKLKSGSVGFIARTASEGASEKELARDMRHLISLWKAIRKKSENRRSTALLYQEPSLAIRAIRDFVSSDTKKIVVDSKDVHRELMNYIKSSSLTKGVKIELYDEPTPIFSRYGVEEEINKITDKKVWLKSGGYLIIDLAEALTVIDVNTGKYLKGATQEETIYDINIEAAHEVVRQIRLRNLVGIIVIDFIDLKDAAKRKEVCDTFVEAMQNDRARSVVTEMSPFSVVQMTRQRARENLLSTIAEQCGCCAGTGLVKSTETTVYEALRAIKSRLQKKPATKITLRAQEAVANTLEKLEGKRLREFLSRQGVEIEIKPVKGQADGYYDIKASSDRRSGKKS